MGLATVTAGGDALFGAASFSQPASRSEPALLVVFSENPPSYCGRTRHASLAVSSRPALVESQAGDQVYVVGAGDKVQSRRVKVNGAHEGEWVIAKGLKAGERVVVEGTQKVRDGILVELKKAGTPKG